VQWLAWFTFLGPGALVVALIFAAIIPCRLPWFVSQALGGVVAIVVAWKIGEWSGAYDDPDPENCSDCGYGSAFALVAMLASSLGWLLGTAFGGVVRLRIRR
jgi:hypothetical protein